jgi:hypothetical protein
MYGNDAHVFTYYLHITPYDTLQLQDILMNSKPRIGVSARGLGKVFSGPNSYIENFTRELIRQARDYEIHVYYNSSESLGLFKDALEHLVPGPNIPFGIMFSCPNK